MSSHAPATMESDSAQSQVAFMAKHKGLSMAEKLKLWKAQKAKQEGAATAAAPTTAATASKPPAAPKAASAAAASAAPAARKPLSGVTASTNNKRSWDSVTTVAASSAAGPKSVGAKPVAISSKPASNTAATINKRAKIVHKPSAVAAKSTSSSSGSAASSVQVTPAASAQTTPAASAHTSPVQQQQQQQQTIETSSAEEDAPMASSMDTTRADVAAQLASPATPPAPARSAAAAAAFTTPFSSLPTISFMTPASMAAASHVSSAAASEALNARLAAWKASRGVQLMSSVSKAKARVMDEKRRQAQEVKSSLSQMQSAAAGFNMGTKARQGTPSLKLSGLATLGLDSAFSRMQSLMRRGAWADAERTVMQLLAVPQTAAEVEARAEVWVCRAYIAEQLGHMDQVVALYDAARQIHPTSTADDASFQQTIHRGLQSFMCRLAGVDAVTESERQPKVLDQFVAQTMSLAEESSNDDAAAAAEAAAAEAAAAAAAQEAKDEAAMDAILSAGNDSFASVDGASTLLTPSHAASQRRLATPVSSNLRAALMGDSSSNFPLGSPAGRVLRPSAAAAAAASFTPRSEALRLELSLQKTPPLSASAKQHAAASSRTMTPLSSMLAAELRQDKTPPEAAGSMASLRKDALRITSAPRPSATKSVFGSAARLTAANSIAEATLSPSLSAPNSAEAHSPSLSDSGVSPVLGEARRESLPLLTGVVRNLLGEMDEDHMHPAAAAGDELNTSSVSCASLGASPAKDAAAAASASLSSAAAAVMEFLDESMDAPVAEAEEETQQEREALESERMDLFDQSEYIPGLSTPAAYPSYASSSAAAASPSPMRMPSASPSKRTLTPSKAAQTLSHVLELEQQGSSKVVLASLRAHPRDAARMGSATFLSPVRRSSRRSIAAGPLTSELASMDQAGLTKLLEANNFAYHPNPALGRALTPIPRERAKPVAASAASTPAMERIAETMVDDEAAASSSAATPARSGSSSRHSLRQATPIAAPRTASAMVGASVVVLQPVRSRHGRRSSSGAVDPKSAEYLLSPVRRSSRHTAPQSLSELTHLLAHTQYAYAPNPLLEEEVKLMQQQQSESALAAIHEALSEEDEDDDEEEEKETKEPEPVQKQQDTSRMLSAAELDAEADRAADAFEAELHKQMADEADARAAAEEEEKLLQQDCMMSSFALAYARSPAPAAAAASSSSSSVSAATRVATPMPQAKKTHSHMLVESNAKSNWEPSFSSNSGSASSSTIEATLQEVAAKEDKYARMQQQQQQAADSVFSSPFAFGPSSIPASAPSVSSKDAAMAPRVHEKDADGFFVPLVPARYSKAAKTGAGSKRKQHGSMDDLEEQLSAVSVAAQAQAQARAQAAKRIATPRPNSKKQRVSMVAASSMMDQSTDDEDEQDEAVHELPAPSFTKQQRHAVTPIAATRRSTRVATPMH